MQKGAEGGIRIRRRRFSAERSTMDKTNPGIREVSSDSFFFYG